MRVQTRSEPENRLYFLDNLRYLMVFLVVPLHSLMSYWTDAASQQPVSDARLGPVSPMVFLILESFPMEILFFIAGYFAVSSLQREGYASFAMRKVKRLGIPYALCVVFQIPVLEYIRGYTHSAPGSAPSLLTVWTAHLQRLFTPHLGKIDFSVHFFPTVFWFLSALLAFFLVFAVICRVIVKIQGPDFLNPGAHDPASIVPTVMAFGCAGAIGCFVLNFFISDWDWFSLGNVLVFRPTRIFIYAAFFSMGILASVRQGFRGPRFPGRTWMYAASSVILLLCLLIVVIQIAVFKSSSIIIQLAHGFLRSFFCISVLGLLVSAAYPRWNGYSGVNRKLAANSYNVYLVHYIIVVLYQLLMLGFPGIPAYVKFLAVSVVSGMTTYAICEYLVRPCPKIFAGVLVALFFILVLIL